MIQATILSQLIILVVLQFLIISPILFLSLKMKTRDAYLTALVFAAFLLFHQVLLYSHLLAFQFIKERWNWVGKSLAIFGSVLFLIFYKKYPIAEYGITFHQRRNSIRVSLIVLGALVLAALIVGVFILRRTHIDLDTLTFELTMPAIDEELAYRGIMIGLLSQILVDKVGIGNLKFINPSVLITSIIFGLTHALALGKSFAISFDLFTFLWNFAFGLLVGWVFVRSRSILFPIVIHSLSF